MTSEPILVPQRPKLEMVSVFVNRLILERFDPEVAAALVAAYSSSANMARDLETFNSAIAVLEPLKHQRNRNLRRLRSQLLTLLRQGIAPRYPNLAAQVAALSSERQQHRRFPWGGVSAVITALAALVGALASFQSFPW